MLIKMDTGNVGIGSTEPASKLQISTAGVSGVTSVVAVATAAAANSEVFIVKGDGKIGIGTSAPSTQLNMKAPTGTDAVILLEGDINNTDENDQALLKLTQNGGGTAAHFGLGSAKNTFTATPSGTVFALQLSSGITIANNDPLKLASGGYVEFGDGTRQLTAAVAGGSGGWTEAGAVVKLNDITDMVGIGNTAPTGKLHVSSGTLMIDGNASSLFQIGASSLVVTGTGHVGMGTASPALVSGTSDSLLEISGASGNFRIYDATAGADRLTITKPGSIGIGTSFPRLISMYRARTLSPPTRS